MQSRTTTQSMSAAAGIAPAGASSIEDGIVVDLSRHLSGVTIDPAEKLAYVGGGAIWETGR